MTRPRRLLLGSSLILAIGCAAASAVKPADRVKLELLALREACAACGPSCGDAEVQAACAILAERDDAPVSGDSGPAVGVGGR